MKNSSVILLVACLLFARESFGQTNFVDARIVTKAGDTTAVQIDNRDWKKNPTTITAQTPDGTTRQYRGSDILGFFLVPTKEWYKGAIVTLDKTSLKSADVLKNINRRGTDTDTIFLKVHIENRLSLYSVTDEYAQRHFIVAKDGKMEVLKVDKKRVLQPKEGVVVFNIYRSQLSALVSDCKQGILKTDALAFTENALVKFISDYNACVGGGSGFEAQIEKSQFRFFVLAGVHLSALTYKAPAPAKPIKYSSPAGPVGGIALEIVFPRKRRSLSIYNELMYRSYDMDNRYSATQLKMWNGFRYTFPSSNSTRIFGGLSISNALAIDYETSGPPGSFRTYEQGISVDAGVVAGRLQYLLRYERANGFSSAVTTQTSFSNLYVTVGYSFSKRK